MSGSNGAGDGKGASEDKVPGRERSPNPRAKRFYATVTVEPRDGAFAVLLDQRMIRTPRKASLLLPSRPFAEAVASEWAAQTERIDPETMGLTRLANTAIDAVRDHMREVAADIASFAASDLLCYRAAEPEELARRQRASWDPVLAWAAAELAAVFVLAEGVIHVAQPPQMPAGITRALDGLDAFRLASLYVMTTLTGSAVLALAAARGRLSVGDAWAAAHVDEDWQIERWGEDAEAADRRARRRSEFETACRAYALAGEGR